MSQCIAKTTKGLRCKHIGHVFESLCRLHHNISYKNDEAYKARYDTRPNRMSPVLIHEEEEEEEVVMVSAKKKPVRTRVAPVLMHEEGEDKEEDKKEDKKDKEYIPVPVKKKVQRTREPKVSPAGVPPPVVLTPEEVAAAAAAAAETAAATYRAKKIAARNKYLEKLNTPSSDDLITNALYIVKLESYNAISNISKNYANVYAILRYYPIVGIHTANMITLLKAVANLDLSTNHNYSEYSYTTIPNEQKEVLFEAIKTALVPFGEFNPLDVIPKTDKYFKMIRSRLLHIQYQERRAVEAAAAEAAREVARAAWAEHAARVAADPAEIERRRLFAIQLREAPVVFRRDPEGGIDLAAFATDMQNIHRSSVQTATEKAVTQLMLRSVDPDQDTLPEITKDLQNPKKISMTSDTREKIIMELNHDYYESVAFSVPYGDVLDRVWTFIRSHKHRDDIFLRLAQEILEGIGMCTNGKMARLVNVLQGFDETLLVEAPKEVFQDKFALLRKLPNAAGERGVAAQALFEEFSIPEAERAVWLEALLEE